MLMQICTSFSIRLGLCYSVRFYCFRSLLDAVQRSMDSYNTCIGFGGHFCSLKKNVFAYSMAEKERESFPITRLLPQMPTWLGMGQAEAEIWELSPGLSHGWQELTCLTHPLPPPGLCVSRKLVPGTELGLRFTAEPNAGPWTNSLKSVLYWKSESQEEEKAFGMQISFTSNESLKSLLWLHQPSSQNGYLKPSQSFSGIFQ